MPKRVATCRLRDARLDDSLPHFPLQNRLMEVVPALLAGNPIRVVLRCWKNPVPSPIFPRVRVFPVERIRESHATQTIVQVLLVLACLVP
jgi:hypothetical protein